MTSIEAQFYITCQKGDLAKCKLIYASYPSLQNVKELLYVAMREATDCGHVSLCAWLIEKGVPANSKSWSGLSYLHAAARCGYYEMCVLLLAHGARHDVDKGTTTPFGVASCNEHYNVCDLLLSHGADINARESYQRTPLLEACAHSKSQVCMFLIARGADIHAQDKFGRTALCYAWSFCQTEVRALLIANGAKVNPCCAASMKYGFPHVDCDPW